MLIRSGFSAFICIGSRNICFALPLNTWLSSRIKYRHWAGSLLSWSLSIFAVGLGAWLASAPILLYHFYSVNPLACIYTVITFPMVALILLLGIAKFIFTFVFPTVALFLAWLLSTVSSGLTWLVKLLSCIPLSQITVGKVSVYAVLMLYLALLILYWLWFNQSKLKVAVTTAFLAVLIITFAFRQWTDNSLADLTVLDVGHGQSIVLRDSGKTIIFDAGSQFRSDIGRRVILPYLKYCGIDHVDAVIISHDDLDHINGVIEIVRDCKVDHVFAGGAFIRKIHTSSTAGYLSQCLAADGWRIEPLEDFDVCDSVKILWPDANACDDLTLSDNNTSVVSLIDLRGVIVLLCSDIEQHAQEKLLSNYPGLHADMIVAPHHGSSITTGTGFVETLGGNNIICSSGIRHWQKLVAQGDSGCIEWLYTAKNGAIIIHVSRTGKLTITTTLGD